MHSLMPSSSSLNFRQDFLTSPAQLAVFRSVASFVVDSIDLWPVFLSQARIWSQQAVTAKHIQAQIQTILADFLENQVPGVCNGFRLQFSGAVDLPWHFSVQTRFIRERGRGTW
jgi:hypothetical protein